MHMTQPLLSGLTAISAAILGSCGTTTIVHSSYSSTFDHKRVIEIDLDEEPHESFELWSSLGDITVVGVPGQTRLLVECQETRPGVAEVWLDEDGKMVVPEHVEEDMVVLNVRLECNFIDGSLETDAGIGNTTISGVPIRGPLKTQSSIGDVLIERIGSPESIEIDSSAGNVQVHDFETEQATIDIDIGNASLEDLTSPRVFVTVGIGDAEVHRSSITRLYVGCSIGDITVTDSQIEKSTLETNGGVVTE